MGYRYIHRHMYMFRKQSGIYPGWSSAWVLLDLFPCLVSSVAGTYT